MRAFGWILVVAFAFASQPLNRDAHAACPVPPSDMPERADRWEDPGSTAVWRVEMIGKTGRYGHGIMGRLADSEGLMVSVSGVNPKPCPAILSLPRSKVIEDIAPRFADVTGDGKPEILTVVSSSRGGGRLAIYDLALEPVALGPEIGRRFRWLAIAGTGDFDGDGRIDIAYVETPHLGKTLRIWTLKKGELVEIGQRPGLTNHRIGEEFISSAVRNCSNGDEVVLADARWERILTARIVNGDVIVSDFGPFKGAESIFAAADC